ncbi:MAG TPA: IPT/TIG domain-containing protein [Gammaproteobacteria bacterium]|nr:IPT/TIG domain-containing protein [Gammaproteobacteria bacterium]
MTTAPIRTWILDGSNDGVVGGGIQLQIRNDSADYCAPTVSSLSPANSPRGRTVTLNITGTGFVSSLNVELTQGSVSLPVSVVTADYSAITASVAIPGDAPKGFYDLRVWRSGDAPVILPDAFQVTDSASAVKALLRLSPGVLLTGTTGAGVYKSVDGGASWTQTNTGLTDLNVTALAAAVDGSAVYAGTLTAGVFKSTDGGATWAPTGTGLDPHIHSLLANPANPLALFAGTDKGVYKTIDGGQSWQPMTNGLP